MKGHFQEKLYQEVIDVVGPDSSVQSEHLPQLKYTQMVIHESMRIFPSVLMIARHAEDTINLGEYSRMVVYVKFSIPSEKHLKTTIRKHQLP